MITKINTVSYLDNSQNNKISFKGGRFNVIKYALDPYKSVNTNYLYTKLFLSKDILQIEKQKGIENPLFKLNKPFKRHKAGFFYRLVSKFQRETFYERKSEVVEQKRELVYDLYNKVKYPTYAHKFLASSSTYSIEDCNKIFELMNEDKYKAKLVNKIIATVDNNFFTLLPVDSLLEILNSKNCKFISKNYSKAEKFVLNQKNNADFSILCLPKMLEDFVSKCPKKELTFVSKIQSLAKNIFKSFKTNGQ